MNANKRLKPMDKVKILETGEECIVNSAHYINDMLTMEQGVTLCEKGLDKVYGATELSLVT